MLQIIYSSGQLSHKTLLFTRREVNCSQPLHFSAYAEEKVSEASVEQEGVRVGGKLSELYEDDFLRSHHYLDNC